MRLKEPARYLYFNCGMELILSGRAEEIVECVSLVVRFVGSLLHPRMIAK